VTQGRVIRLFKALKDLQKILNAVYAVRCLFWICTLRAR